MCVCVVSDSPVKTYTKNFNILPRNLLQDLLQIYYRFTIGLLQTFYTILADLLYKLGAMLVVGASKNSFTDNFQIDNVPAC